MNTSLQGLTTEEILVIRARGQVNQFPSPSSRSYSQIIRENVFSFINNILFGLGIALILLGRTSDALVSVGVILINLMVSLVQEIRTKRTLDKIALLTRPTAQVVREGREQVLPPEEIVMGDLLVVRPGDQLVVDGQVVSGSMDVDESLLTGEAEPISKKIGDPVFSGSFCLSGSAYFTAQKVGEHSLANRLTTGARAFRKVLTPLQQQINLVLRVILMVAIYFEALLAINAFIEHTTLVESVRISVVVIGLVPNGLFVSIALAYALGAVRIAGKGALVQQANAIESLSNVDVLCLDKTGTLTTNRFLFEGLLPLGIPETELRQRLGDFCASQTDSNRTSEAIAAACPGQKRAVIAEIPFSSDLKWSALTFTSEGKNGTYVLGALEILAPALRPEVGNLEARADAWARLGLRVLLFAFHPGQPVLADANLKPCLPPDLTPLGLISLRDELRPEARETLASFTRAGVRLKIISGDNPQTVAALARQAGLDTELSIITGPALAAMAPETFAATVERIDIFGRITPQQKENIIKTLRANGHYVAMTGDGVNDVLSLKQADLAIAMQSGSQATRSVADIILVGNSFAAIPFAVLEGQRIINGMQDILKLFLTRIGYTTLLILSATLIGAFPYDPRQGTILTLLTVGLPSVALAAWAKPGKPPRRDQMVRQLLHFVFPAALTISMAGLAVFLVYLMPDLRADQIQVPQLALARTGLTSFSILCGLLLIPFVEPPSQAWVGGEEVKGDRRPGWLALGSLICLLAVWSIPGLRTLFDLRPMPPTHYLVMAVGATLWGLLLRWIWRGRVVDRFLDTRLDINPKN